MSKQDDVMKGLGVFIDPHVKLPASIVPPPLIVKVQAPLNNPSGDYLIYDEHHTFELMSRPSPELKHRMGGAAKKYFYARLTGPLEDRTLSLQEEAPAQSW